MIKPFDLVRSRLEQQYLDVRFDPASGRSGEELLAELNRHRAEHPDEPRILTRSWLLRLICSKGRIAPDPEDYFADKVEHHNMLVNLRNEWSREEHGREFRNEPPTVPGSLTSILDLSHTSPDWRNLLRYGFIGLRDRAAARPGAFYQAVAMVYEGAAALARRLGEASGNAPLSALAERPPQTFREALQLAYLYHEIQEMDGEPLRSMGRFDHLYYDFYANDLKAGRLTRDQAKELLKFFWIKFYAKTQGKAFGKPFLFGPDVNELSYLGFEVYREMQTADPKFHVRLAERTPRDFLEKVVECIQIGCTSVVIVNDPRQIEMLRRNGKRLEDAEDYLLIGCYEPAVMGKELNCSGAAAVNLAKVVELTLADGDPAAFDDFMAAYFSTLESQIAIAIDQTRRRERLWPRVNPSPVLSGTMDSCLEKGLDVSEAGAKYNTTGFLFAGLANAVDSLAAIEQLVYCERRCSLAKLKAALAADWQGFEELRLAARNRVPKWGNNDDRVDRFAVAITGFAGKRINREPNARGGVFQAALYAILPTAQRFGKLTGALPDGRRAGEPLAINTGSMVAMDRDGVTSLINSVTKIDLAQFPNGTVLDVMFHPTAVRGAEGIQTMISVIRTHFDQGGMAIQFNIFDADTLRDAQRNPQKYVNLQVRLCGWNVRFADLSPKEQEMFIAKAEGV
ncbi:MAG: glycyl radical enzyme domain-containing protein [Planctomycetota bacterium]